MKIEALYTEACNLYGDSFNVTYLQKSLRDAEFIFTAFNETPRFVSEDVDLIYMGAMPEREQEYVIEQLRLHMERIRALIKEIEANLRMEEHFTGLQTALNMLALKTGFGSNHWQFDRGHITTATQIIAANSEEYRTQCKHEIILKQVLIDLARIILRLGNSFLGQTLNEDIEISVDFDESVIEDKAADFERDCRMLELGVLSKEEFRAKWMNEDLKTSGKAIQEIPDKETS